jgi:hypothetical protein
MNIKACLLIPAVLLSMYANAQDKIYKKSGGVIDAKVKMVSDNAIEYKRANNADGPDYTILKRDVDKIVYQNGTVDNFEEGGHDGIHAHGKGKSVKPKYGDNIISVMPVYTAQLDGGTDFPGFSDPGIGISYERLLDKNGHISFYLPVVLSFASQGDYRSYTTTLGNSGYTSVMFMPGIKFYPARNTEKFRYSLGASFFAMTGNEPYAVYDYSYTSSYIGGDWNYTMYGIMVINSLNVTVNHLFVAFDFGMGVPFSDNRRRNYTFIDNPFPIVQFGVKVGVRF